MIWKVIERGLSHIVTYDAQEITPWELLESVILKHVNHIMPVHVQDQ